MTDPAQPTQSPPPSPAPPPSPGSPAADASPAIPASVTAPALDSPNPLAATGATRTAARATQTVPGLPTSQAERPDPAPGDQAGPAHGTVFGGLRQVLTSRPHGDQALASVVRALGGVVAVCCLIMSITNGMLGLGPMPVIMNLIIPVVVLIAVVYIEDTNKFLGAYTAIIALLFLGLFPFGFFMGGGVDGVMPYYFLIGVALTAFMLQGWRFVVAVALELCEFSGCMWVALAHPEYVWPKQDHTGLALSQPVGFICAAAVIALSVQLVYFHYVRIAGELNDSNEALRAAGRNKDAFLALLAHELKTPVAIMSSHAQEAERILGAGGEAPANLERIRSDMATVRRQALSLSSMVTQLLDINRIDDGRLAFSFARVSLAQVVQETMAECAMLLGPKGAMLRLSAGGAHPTVMADPDRINRVLLNLIANAARHTDEGTITISIAKEGRFARVSVTDTGEGMTPEQIDLVMATPTVGSAEAYRLRQRERAKKGDAGGAGGTGGAEGVGGAGGARGGAEGAAGAGGVGGGGAGQRTGRMALPVASGSRHGGLGLGLRIVRHTVAGHGGEFT
ncbi:MAG: HAMP domain-containing histidine kinase, partial [Bifidobacteriaceae bacterium]|nr:HAMP domain-containing histidine kinase [Bifidobacteriaceae bacterium]